MVFDIQMMVLKHMMNSKFGAVLFLFFHHLPLLTQFLSLITHHSSLIT